MDFAKARRMMVDAQVRTNDVTELALQAALNALPREAFAPPSLSPLAYADLDLEVAPGRFLLRPRDLAKLIQALAPRAGDRALEIAGATGYGAAVLARLVKEVVTLDSDPDQTLAARKAFDAVRARNVQAVSTSLAQGWADGAPYDVILLNGGTEIVPEAWLAQLAEGGRMAVIVRDGPAGRARLYTKAGGAAAYRNVFDAAPPVVPGLAKPPAFTF
jgi:protein-L-isoaspartate(D-aspartate) O-methyltransferase